MKACALAILAAIFCALPAGATTVTATGVADSRGNLYANGSVGAALTFNSGQTPTAPGGPVVLNYGPDAIDARGSFSIVLTDTSTITPTNSAYVFTLCALSVDLGPAVPRVQVCFTTGPIAITGTTQDITTQLNALSKILGPQFSGGGGSLTPTYSPSDTTIVATWTTTSSANSNIACGGKNGIDNGLAPSSTSHQAIVTGLSPNTAYSCQVTSGSSSSTAQNVTTLAAAARTPITGLTLGSNVSAPTADGGDYPYTFVSNDANQYIVQDDGYGFAASQNSGANMQIGILTSPSTMVGTNLNQLTGYGGYNTSTGSDCPNRSGNRMTNKQVGVFGMSGNLYISAYRQCGTFGGASLEFGNQIMSANHGTSWNNYLATGTFNANGSPVAQGSYQYPLPAIGAVFPIRYGADDGTLGYLTPDNRIDGADGFVYMVFMLSPNQTNMYLMRQPRILFEQQATTGFTFWAGPSCTSSSFVNDSNWASSQATAVSIYTPAEDVGAITFIPGLNRYFLINSSYPTANPVYSLFQFYDAPEPCGPFTLVAQMANAPAGYYAPIPLHSSVIGNSATQNVAINYLHTGALESGNYWFHNQAVTLNPSTLSSQQLLSYGCNPSENPISDGGNFSALTGYATVQSVSGAQCEASSTANAGYVVWAAPPVAGDTKAPWPADQCSEAALTTVDSTGYVGMGVRMTAAAGTGYLALWNGAGNGSLYKLTGAGAASSIGSIGGAIATGQIVKLCVAGTTLTAYVNGSSVGTTTDSTYATGNPGFGTYGSSAVTDGRIGEWDAIANQAAAPAFSVVSHGYSGTVTLTSPTTGATLYYTTNGTQPTRSSTTLANGGSLKVTAPETLRAMAALTDYADSQVTTVSY